MVDISIKSEILMIVLNTIEAEHHARFSYLSTKNEIWLDRLLEMRKLRAKYMALIEKEEDSQKHCYQKHLLSCVFRLFETGDKYLEEDRKKAKECYEDADRLLEVFIKDNWLDNNEKKTKRWFRK